jgi:hypothetical protein
VVCADFEGLLRESPGSGLPSRLEPHCEPRRRRSRPPEECHVRRSTPLSSWSPAATATEYERRPGVLFSGRGAACRRGRGAEPRAGARARAGGGGRRGRRGGFYERTMLQ